MALVMSRFADYERRKMKKIFMKKEKQQGLPGYLKW